MIHSDRTGTSMSTRLGKGDNLCVGVVILKSGRDLYWVSLLSLRVSSSVG